MKEIAKSFVRVREMKGSENSQVMAAIQNISSPFNNTAIAEEDVASKMKSHVLSIVE